MEQDFSSHPMLLQNITMVTSSDLAELLINDSYINVTSIEQHLDVIDNAACGWLNLAGSVDFNIYQAFADEESLIEYILNDALEENVTVFASKYSLSLLVNIPFLLYKIMSCFLSRLATVRTQ